jgi:hypothetical protein
LLFFDDRGRWTELPQENILAQTVGFLDGKPAGLAVLTVDLRRLGRHATGQLPYEMASWGHSSRWILLRLCRQRRTYHRHADS